MSFAACERFQSGDRTALLSSHLLDDVERIADRILIMVNGRIAVDCPLESLVDRVSSCTVELDEAAIGGSLVAFGLGLAQFMLDQRSSARAFLVHRSLTPSQLFRGKLLVGLGIYALGVGGPLMLLSAPSPTANVPIGWERRFILTITSIAIVAAIGGTFVRKATRS